MRFATRLSAPPVLDVAAAVVDAAEVPLEPPLAELAGARPNTPPATLAGTPLLLVPLAADL